MGFKPQLFFLTLKPNTGYKQGRITIRLVFKQFKTGDERHSFLVKLQKRGIEKMLVGELDAHLGYDKHDKTDGTNARNGFSTKKIKTSYGESEIQVPRDRDATFNPMLIPKRKNMVDGLENVIVSL